MSWPKNRKRPELSGRNHPMWGKKRPDLVERNKSIKMREIRIEQNKKRIGENNPMWGRKRPDTSEWNRINKMGKNNPG